MGKQTEFKKIFVADFETTTDINNCYVWSVAFFDLADEPKSENVTLFESIDSFINALYYIPVNSVIYFHNLKFDGTFILHYLLSHAEIYRSRTTEEQQSVKNYKLMKNDYTYVIGDNGAWYKITLCLRKEVYIEIRDSLKIMPKALKKLCEDFNVEHKKTSMEFENKFSLRDCSADDLTYIRNDVLGLAECLIEFAKLYELKKLTIGSQALATYKDIVKESKNTLTKGNTDIDLKLTDYKQIFYKHEKDECYYKELFKCENHEQFIRKCYKGGYCYANEKYRNKIIGKGIVLDVNSLYPSQMYTQKYPVGKAYEYVGNIKNVNTGMKDYYYFCMIKVNHVKLRKGYLPTLQIKNNFMFKANEYIKKIDEEYPVTLYLTQTDFELLQKHYTIGYIEFVGGLYCALQADLFKNYIDKFMQMKKESKGAKREIAKLFLNSLYGKFASKRTTHYKIIELQPDGTMKYKTILTDELKSSVNIAIGCCVTAFAREYTIKASQLNYKYHCYSDTDSMHLCCDITEVKGVFIDDKELGAWKLENTFEEAKFLRQKTYCEKIKGQYHVTGCGMNADCKNIVIDNINDMGLDWFAEGVTIINGKLTPKLVNGGTVLVNSTFTIKK